MLKKTHTHTQNPQKTLTVKSKEGIIGYQIAFNLLMSHTCVTVVLK